jgi:hypothetical protein
MCLELSPMQQGYFFNQFKDMFLTLGMHALMETLVCWETSKTDAKVYICNSERTVEYHIESPAMWHQKGVSPGPQGNSR